MKFVDCHCHLADQRWGGHLEQVFANALDLGVDFFMQGGVDPEDWQRQMELANHYPERIGLCFGIHPYRSLSEPPEACRPISRAQVQDQLDLLAQVLPKALALGETGLDFREKWGGGDPEIQELQMDLFSQQLELAQWAGKPLVLHVVRAHHEALRILDFFGDSTRSISRRSGMVHAFNGSWEIAQEYLRRGFALSIGGAVTDPMNSKLRKAVLKIPLECILVESDSPDQLPFGSSDPLNTPSSIWQVAQVLAELRGTTATELLAAVCKNFCRIFDLSPGKRNGP